ncbi:MAG: hypothetical protein GC189_01325 [Alphaproteobacteria bacterium]|nr:hypothetical protein [Alphaproteobacteria bacterium]
MAHRGWMTFGQAAAMALAVAMAPAAAQAFDADDEQQDDYVQGNLLFLAYHEVGHLILDQVIGADQHAERLDAELDADDIASWLMLPDPDETDQSLEILAAVRGWEQSGELGAGALAQNPHYPDDLDRAARITCLVFGANPDVYAEFEGDFDGAIDTDICVEEHNLLHEEFEEWFGEALVPPASPSGRIAVIYERPAAGYEGVVSYLQETQVLQDVADDISEFVSLPDDVTLTARSCGGGRAEFSYNPAQRRITACYEAVAWFMNNLPVELGGSGVSGATGRWSEPQADGDELGSGGARVQRRPRAAPPPPPPPPRRR